MLQKKSYIKFLQQFSTSREKIYLLPKIDLLKNINYMKVMYKY